MRRTPRRFGVGSFQSWLNTLLAAVGPAVLLWQLYRVERRVTTTAKGAEDAATLAAGHAAAATEVVAQMASDVKELALSTNGIQVELNKVNREAGNLEGRAAAQAEAKEST